MKVSKTVDELRLITKQWRADGYTVGLVPTMGYLHEGHGSLIERCRKENDKVIVSIFVNPTQFGENEDLGAYPRDFERDKYLCEKFGCDLIFNPEPSEMYIDSHTYVNIDGLSDYLCGKSRPVHFKGVCTVVSKLFNIVHPHKAYFGEKDAQQLAIIKKMVKDLNFDVNIVGCPIVREEDGLAKSSRNAYLSEEERKSALCLSRSIKKGQEIIGNSQKSSEVIDAMTMQPVSEIKENVLVAMAVYIGKTRLIDNFTWEVK